MNSIFTVNSTDNEPGTLPLHRQETDTQFRDHYPSKVCMHSMSQLDHVNSRHGLLIKTRRKSQNILFLDIGYLHDNIVTQHVCPAV